MEGLRLIRLARPARASRPMALLGAVATLLAALFLCLGPSGHAADADGHPGALSARAGAPAAPSLPAAGAPRPFEAYEAYEALHDGVGGRYTCPLDGRDCGLLPSLTPAVLTAPPLDPPLHAHGAAVAARAPAPVLPSAAWSVPRAPDLHVLQVLRT
ncbi:hypothetical protein BJP40_07260 [Streptomyces sp. CC53]|uniref:hypothetical protein n=1 Tax=unclassified Streptomyces TaxID=2593676 RepID=UPI0008DE7097|nr:MULTISPECIES: hypothetical protein [unclassified Streptomyces]OII61031.1 hypothetical protein BJP40_07260 [Streptomyces sp. CC53]